MSRKLIADKLIREGFGPMVQTGGAAKETKEQNNGLLLASGDHIVIRMEKPGTTITSAPDAVIRKQTVSESSSIAYGLTYRCDGDTPAVSVPAGGSMVLKGCHFFKEANIQGAASSYITVASGGHVSCIGCHFHGVQAAGNVILTAGPPNSSSAVGCFNATSRGNSGNVQTIGEVVV